MKHYAEVMRSLCGALCAYGRLCGTLCGGLCAPEGKCTKQNESPAMAKFSFELAWLSLVSHFHLSRPGMFGGSSVRSEQPPIHRPNKKGHYGVTCSQLLVLGASGCAAPSDAQRQTASSASPQGSHRDHAQASPSATSEAGTRSAMELLPLNAFLPPLEWAWGRWSLLQFPPH